MNEASRKVIEAALEAAQVRINNSQQEVGALERALETAKTNKETDEQTITELTAALATEEKPAEEPPAAEG